jgi:hypothetical protein
LVFIAAPCGFAQRGEVVRLGTFERFDLGRANEQEQSQVWLLRASG